MTETVQPEAALGGVFAKFLKLATDLRAKNWQAVVADVIDILQQFGGMAGGAGGVPSAALANTPGGADAVAAQIEAVVAQHQVAPGGAQAALGSGALLKIFGPLLLQAIQAWLSRQ